MKWNEDLYHLADRVFADRRDASAEAPRGDTVLWEVLQDLGWPHVGIDEDAGGVGGGLGDLMEIVRAAGRHNALVPLIETSVAAWIISHGDGRAADLGSATSVVVDDQLDWTDAAGGIVVSGAVRRVPWADTATTLLLLRQTSTTSTTVAMVKSGEPGSFSVSSGTNLAGEPWADLELEALFVSDTNLVDVPLAVKEMSDRAGILRAAAILGAVERAVDHAAQHVATRQQFGRPLVKLQAVQHLLASIMCERDLLGAAMLSVLAAAEPSGPGAAAAATAGRVAGRVGAVAHQLHGAIGITQEHDLHLSTSRLMAWRDAPRSQRSWEQEVGELVAGEDDQALWDLMTNETPAGAL